MEGEFVTATKGLVRAAGFVVCLLGATSQSAYAAPVFEIGGTNYFNYDLGQWAEHPTECNLGSIKGVLTSFYDNPELVRAQLQTLCNRGQRKIALMLRFWSDNTWMGDYYGATANSYGYLDSAGVFQSGEPRPSLKHNIAGIVNLVGTMTRSSGDRCFNELQFRFAPDWNANPVNWQGGWDSSMYGKDRTFIFAALDAVESAASSFPSLRRTYDLGAEQAGRDEGQNGRYLHDLWQDYIRTYGSVANTYGFSFAPSKCRGERMKKIYSDVGVWPPEYALDVYPTPEGDHFSDDGGVGIILDELDPNNARPLVIQETYFASENPPAFSSEIFAAAHARGVPIRTVMQWPYRVKDNPAYCSTNPTSPLCPVSTWIYLPESVDNIVVITPKPIIDNNGFGCSDGNCIWITGEYLSDYDSYTNCCHVELFAPNWSYLGRQSSVCYPGGMQVTFAFPPSYRQYGGLRVMVVNDFGVRNGPVWIGF